MIRLLTTDKRFVRLTRGYTWRPRPGDVRALFPLSIPTGFCFIDGLRRFTFVRGRAERGGFSFYVRAPPRFRRMPPANRFHFLLFRLRDPHQAQAV